jgi:hypothetical protein
MAFSEELAERIRQGLARRKGIEEKKMFGGIGFGRGGAAAPLGDGPCYRAGRRRV